MKPPGPRLKRRWCHRWRPAPVSQVQTLRHQQVRPLPFKKPAAVPLTSQTLRLSRNPWNCLLALGKPAHLHLWIFPPPSAHLRRGEPAPLSNPKHLDQLIQSPGSQTPLLSLILPVPLCPRSPCRRPRPPSSLPCQALKSNRRASYHPSPQHPAQCRRQKVAQQRHLRCSKRCRWPSLRRAPF